MKKSDVIRAWEDEEYRDSLSAEERATLPENPAGLCAVDDDVLRSITGGCCPTIPGCGGPDTQNAPACSCVPPGHYCP